MADVAEVESKFTAGKFNDSGKAAADAVQQLAGPVHPAKNVALPPITPKSVGGFVAGLLDGFVVENNLSEIEKCYENGAPIEAELAKVLADAKDGNWADAIQQLQTIAAAFPAELAACKSSTTDIALLSPGLRESTRKLSRRTSSYTTPRLRLMSRKLRLTTPLESSWTPVKPLLMLSCKSLDPLTPLSFSNDLDYYLIPHPFK